MNPFEMVVMIVLIVTIGRVLSGRMGNRTRHMLKTGQQPAPDNGENIRLQSEVARLNDRIRVLERLATDPAKRLAEEIDSLKDK
jgi:cation transport ATPase